MAYQGTSVHQPVGDDVRVRGDVSVGVSNGDLGAEHMWVGAGEKRACFGNGGLHACHFLTL